jgi:hypothetical protein
MQRDIMLHFIDHEDKNVRLHTVNEIAPYYSQYQDRFLNLQFSRFSFFIIKIFTAVP